LVVALSDVPPEGLELILDIDPEAMVKLVAVGGEAPPALIAPLTGTLRLRRRGARLEVRGSFLVEATLVCDRCLAPASTVLTGEMEDNPLLMDADGPGNVPGNVEDGEEGALAVKDGRVDLAGLLAESFWLAWPYRFICRPDCAGLCPICGADLNRGACGCRKPMG
jgi:uncharacterized protein